MSGSAPPRAARFRRAWRLLPALTMVSVLTITATAEYQLARTVLDLRPEIAWALPAAIDSYVLAALHARRDVGAAVAVMAGALLVSMGAHLAMAPRSANGLTAMVTGPLATAIMIVLVVVAWRVHVLIDTEPAPAPLCDHSVADEVDPDAVSVAVRVLSAPAASAPTAGTPQATMALPRAPSTGPALLAAPGSSAALARPASALEPVVEPHPQPSEEAEADEGGPTDEQILAEIAGQPPSMRALRRDYRLGQARASRIHRLASQNHRTTIRTEQNNQPAEHQNINTNQKLGYWTSGE